MTLEYIIIVAVPVLSAMLGIVLAVIFVPSSPPRGGRRVQHSTAGPDRMAGGVIPLAPAPGGPLNPPATVHTQPTQEVT